MCAECGYTETLDKYAYKVTFELGGHVSVIVYNTQDYADGVVSTVAYSRDSDTGELKKDGDGQVNFGLVFEDGYALDSITIAPDGYKNLKDIGDGIYRITKITSDLTVTINWTYDVETNGLPVIVINTLNAAPITDKENYVTCTVSVVNADEEYCFIDSSAGIRLRGNTTFYYPKKPYRIKFDTKTSLFGLDQNKSWVLLAMYQDFSNIKDYSAFAFADAIGTTAFVPNAIHVEVYLNGSYIGLYLLTDQVDENAGRTGVEADFDASATEVPFLVECDQHAPDEGIEDVDYFKIVNSDRTSYYAVKYPESDERYTQEQFDYIKNYIIKVNELCYSSSVTRAEFEEYVDLSSFIDYYLIQELMGNGDVSWKSVFMSKSLDGKLVMGPLWDFDWAAGGPMSSGGEVTKDTWYSDRNWFSNMLKKSWFKQAVADRWQEIIPTLNEVITGLGEYKTSITAAAERNAVLWDFDTDDTLKGFSDYYDWVLQYYSERITVISTLLS